MKTLLRQFVDWCEVTHSKRGPCGSPFESAVSPVLVLKAQAALEWTVASGQPVTLFTSDISAETLLAGLVLRRSGVAVGKIFRGDLDDNDFARLTHCLAEIKRSGLQIVEGEAPATLRPAAFFGGPLFAIMKLIETKANLAPH